MALTHIGFDEGSGSKTANQSTITHNFAPNAGQTTLVVWLMAMDNNQTTDGDEGAVSSVTTTGSETWAKAVEFCNGQGAAQAGATISIWWSVITSSVVVTANLSNSASRDATGEIGLYFSMAAASTAGVDATATLATDGADPGNVSIGSMTNREHAVVLGLAGEGPSTDAYTTPSPFTASTTAAQGTTGGSAATNMHAFAAWHIATNSSDSCDLTSTTADRDYAQALVAFYEIPFVTPTIRGFDPFIADDAVMKAMAMGRI